MRSGISSKSVEFVSLCVQYPTGCGCEANVVSVVDLTVGYDSRNPPSYTPVSRHIIVHTYPVIINFCLDLLT